MVAALYAEVYLICIIIAALILIWMRSSSANSTEDRWLRLMLVFFLLNFVSNFFFKLFNGGILHTPSFHATCVFLKSCYFCTLALGVYAFCGYAEAEHGGDMFRSRDTKWAMRVLLFVPLFIVAMNLHSWSLFEISPDGDYIRHGSYHFFMLFLLAWTMLFSARVLAKSRHESDPTLKTHLYLVASFPVCILAAWILSFIGESVPVICVCIAVELLCLYMGTSRQQITMDKLTQVNNRHNLISFMEYKLRNHADDVHLLIMDIDFFKTINDTFGHLEGDRALVRLASTLKQSCATYPKRPYIARYGGDEFIVVLEGTLEGAQGLCEQIHADLDASNAASHAEYPLRVSIGVAKLEPGMTTNDLIAAADAQLYEVKKHRQPLFA